MFPPDITKKWILITGVGLVPFAFKITFIDLKQRPYGQCSHSQNFLVLKKMKAFLALLAVLAVANAAVNDAGCGTNSLRNSDDGDRIVGGTNAEKGRYPYQLSLLYLGKYHTCGATIIDDYWALCAAHCVYGRSSPSLFTLRAGANDLSKVEPESSTHELEKIFYVSTRL